MGWGNDRHALGGVLDTQLTGAHLTQQLNNTSLQTSLRQAHMLTTSLNKSVHTATHLHSVYTPGGAVQAGRV